jgi:hypothetical protein
MPNGSEDSVSLSLPRPQQSWFVKDKAATLQSSVAEAMGALEEGARSYSLASITEALSPVAASPASAAKVATPESSEIEQLVEALKNIPGLLGTEEQTLPAEVDYELAVGALLDEVSTTMDELLEGKLTPTENVVSLIMDSFQNIAKLLGNVPQHLAEEVGELGADVCNVIELKGGNPNPIISFFNP